MSEVILMLAGVVGAIGAFSWLQRGSKEINKRIDPVVRVSSRPENKMTGSNVTTLNDLYRKHGKQKGIDPNLLKAIAIVESGENPDAVNPADPSYGLMQILCTGDGLTCANKLPAIPDWPPTSKNALFSPDLNLHYAAQILSWNINKYGKWKGVAVYNNWGARFDNPDGPFRNQSYVDKVKKEYRAFI